MKRQIFTCITLLLIVSAASSQSIGIGTTVPESSAALDISAASKGLLIPRIALTALNAPSPVTAPANGLIIFNTATAGAGKFSVTPGLYYWNTATAAWVKIYSENQAVWNSTVSDAPAINYTDPIYRTADVYVGTNLNYTANSVLQVGAGASTNKGFLVTGDTATTATVPDLGKGSRMMFYPGKSAFRAGYVSGTEWDDINTGSYSAAFGYNNRAYGRSSFSTGISSTAIGAGSIAMGSNNATWGTNSRVIGVSSTAFGDGSTAIGQNITVSGNYSTGLGYTITTEGDYSTAIGFEATTYGNYSVALGQGVTANAYGSVNVGTYNDPIASSGKLYWLDTNPVLIVGNGPDAANRSNAMVVWQNANTDINGFTRLGNVTENAPRIKMKKLTATTPSSANPYTFTFVPTGIANYAKILSISAIVTDAQYQFLPHSTQVGYLYTVNGDGTNIAVGVQSVALSGSVMNKPVKILITYEE